jgi:methylmalonyl-CoA mutase N-terminal domain/subunit
VGVNRFALADGAGPARPRYETMSADADAEKIQCERLAALRAERDATAVTDSLNAVAQAAREGRNVVPATIDAVRAYATVGEIAEVYRAEFGEWEPDRQF